MSALEELQLGDRVLVQGFRGTLRWMGASDLLPLPHPWVGVELDECAGKNDGSALGHRFFTCEAGYGLLARATRATKLADQTPPPKRTSVHRPHSGSNGTANGITAVEESSQAAHEPQAASQTVNGTQEASHDATGEPSQKIGGDADVDGDNEAPLTLSAFIGDVSAPSSRTSQTSQTQQLISPTSSDRLESPPSEEQAPRQTAFIRPGDAVEAGTGHKGFIRFVGVADFASGRWVGVELEVAEGKNDGSVNGKRYFTCPQKYGIFVRPGAITPWNLYQEQQQELLKPKPQEGIRPALAQVDEPQTKEAGGEQAANAQEGNAEPETVDGSDAPTDAGGPVAESVFKVKKPEGFTSLFSKQVAASTSHKKSKKASTKSSIKSSSTKPNKSSPSSPGSSSNKGTAKSASGTPTTPSRLTSPAARSSVIRRSSRKKADTKAVRSSSRKKPDSGASSGKKPAPPITPRRVNRASTPKSTGPKQTGGRSSIAPARSSRKKPADKERAAGGAARTSRKKVVGKEGLRVNTSSNKSTGSVRSLSTNSRPGSRKKTPARSSSRKKLARPLSSNRGGTKSPPEPLRAVYSSFGGTRGGTFGSPPPIKSRRPKTTSPKRSRSRKSLGGLSRLLSPTASSQARAAKAKDDSAKRKVSLKKKKPSSSSSSVKKRPVPPPFVPTSIPSTSSKPATSPAQEPQEQEKEQQQQGPEQSPQQKQEQEQTPQQVQPGEEEGQTPQGEEQTPGEKQTPQDAGDQEQGKPTETEEKEDEPAGTSDLSSPNDILGKAIRRKERERILSPEEMGTEPTSLRDRVRAFKMQSQQTKERLEREEKQEEEQVEQALEEYGSEVEGDRSDSVELAVDEDENADQDIDETW